MSAKYKSPSFLLPNELNTSANSANDTGINSLYSMDFDSSSSDYIDVGNPSILNFERTDAFTISAWCYFNGTGTMSIFSKLENTAPFRGYSLFQSSTSVLNFYLTNDNSPSNRIAVSANLPSPTTSAWKHIVVSYDGSSNASGVNFYVDGSILSKTILIDTLSSTIITSTSVNIGARAGLSEFFNGKIDEVAIFNRALEPTEIAALYGGTSPNIYPSNLMAADLNPVAYYPLGEQAQNTGYVGSGNPGNPTTLSNVWQFPNGVLQDYVMDFDGTDNINSEANISSVSSFTASIWINRDDSATQYVYGQWVDGTTASQSWVIQTVGGIVYFNVRNSSLAISSAISTTSLTTGIWYNIIAVWTGSNIKLYINNLLEDTAACSSMNNPSTAVKLAIGSSSNNVSPFNGKISNAVIWNSDQESNRDNIYNNGSPQTIYTVTPQNWWKLNTDSVYTPSAPNYTKALSFNGGIGGALINLGNNSTLNITSSLSVSAWFKTLNNTGSIIIATKDDGGSNRAWQLYMISTGSIRFGINGVAALATSSGVYDDGNWHHVVALYEPSNYVKLYIDGVADGEDTSSVPASINDLPSQDVVIGAYSVYDSGTRWNGEISNVAIFDSGLTSSQVSTLFNFGTPETNISFSPQAWWKLDDQTAITDSSGNGNTGTNNGAIDATTSVAVVPSWKIPSALPITTTPNYTTALEFNYKDSIGFGNSIGNLIGDNYTGGLSFSFWINPSATNSDDGVFNFSGNTISFVVRSNSFRLYSSSCTSGQCFSYNYTNPSNEWSHCVISFLPSGSSFYLNGESVATWTYTDLNINGKDFYIGWYYSINYYYIGKLSNFQIWNTNLSSTEASTLYNGGTPIAALSGIPQSSNLISWWKLNDSGSTIIDSAGNNNGSYTFNSATLVASDVLTHQPSNGVSTTLPSTALQQSDLQFDSPYSNYSLSFDGTGDYIDCTDNDIFSFGDGGTDSPFSISAWVNFSDVTNSMILSKHTTGQFEYSFLVMSNDKLIFQLNSQLGSNLISRYYNTPITSYEGQWIHLIGTYDGSSLTSGIKIYLNGTRVDDTDFTSGTYVAMNNGTAPVEIGKRSTDYMNGKIDETAIFNTELTSSQILEIYNNGRPKDLTTFSGTAPISWWRLGENAYFQDTTLVLPNSITGAPNGEASTNNLEMISADAPGTYANGIGTNLDILDRVGDAPLSTSNSQSYNMIPSDISPYVPQYVGDQIANNFSMSFGGVDDFFNIGSSVDFAGKNFTISGWYKITKLSGSSSMFSMGSSKNIGIWHDGNNVVFNTKTDTASWSGIQAGMAKNTWKHVAFTYDGSYQTIYIDGVQAAQGAKTGSQQDDGTDQWIGYLSGVSSYAYEGEIDEVAIFDKALTADQVNFDLYQPSLPAGSNKTADIAKNPNLPTPVAWYRMGD